MSLSATCPHCAHPSTVPDSAAGQPVRCPGCQQVYTAPALPNPKAAARRIAWWACLVVEALLLLLLLGYGTGPDSYGAADALGLAAARLQILGLMFFTAAAARCVDGALRD